MIVSNDGKVYKSSAYGVAQTGSMRTRNVMDDLPLAAPVDVNKALLERLRIVVGGLAGFDSGFSFPQRGYQICALAVREHRDVLHRSDRHTGCAASFDFAGCLVCHKGTIATDIKKVRQH